MEAIIAIWQAIVVKTGLHVFVDAVMVTMVVNNHNVNITNGNTAIIHSSLELKQFDCRLNNYSWTGQMALKMRISFSVHGCATSLLLINLSKDARTTSLHMLLA